MVLKSSAGKIIAKRKNDYEDESINLDSWKVVLFVIVKLQRQNVLTTQTCVPYND